jgi:hypothetical protein
MAAPSPPNRYSGRSAKRVKNTTVSRSSSVLGKRSRLRNFDWPAVRGR